MKTKGRPKSTNIDDRRPRDPLKKKGKSYTGNHTSSDTVGSYGGSTAYGSEEFHHQRKLKELQKKVDEAARKKALNSGRGTKMNRGK